ncbi:hypothetical protein [Puia dinghuensis]|uniref:hypothetical protein n=1 Tax=Puia dinghuensis TaxID=1792502 RepID=UPI00166EE19B|nr:hypothetical protein [Puia dinghuensis]
MIRNKYIRLFVLLLGVSISLVLFSYVRNRSSSADDTNCDGSKCPSRKAKTEYMLLETLTHNLLVSNQQ